MSQCYDHNGPQWLMVRYLCSAQGPGFGRGWYVVRCCPCHFCERLTMPYPDRARAERVRQVILGEVTTPSTPRLFWDVDAEDPPPPLAEGQIWFDRHRRDHRDRHLRIGSVGEDVVLVDTVARRADGQWAVVPGKRPSSRIAAWRFDTEEHFAFVEESL